MTDLLSLHPFRFYRNADDDWIMPMVIDPDKSLWLYWPNDEQLSAPPSYTPGQDQKAVTREGTSFDLLQELLDGDYKETDLLQSPGGDLLQERSGQLEVHQRQPASYGSYIYHHEPWNKHMSTTVVSHKDAHGWTVRHHG